ncbi:zinc finger protein [Trichonephila clavata]|uniref:Zinc finger protein n=1 Tax=Trichonephila clavata TaxID=2740835 RepID=A0A8X6FT55_TRICU|nr:zinc finger protein [Trichonephila clavata]
MWQKLPSNEPITSAYDYTYAEEDRPFSCYICGRKFNRLHHLKLHLMVHLGQSPHTCDICGRTCNQLSDLKKHQMIHTGERPHSCPICNKGFIQHIITHSGSLPYRCKNCGKQFLQVGSYKRHALRGTCVREESYDALEPLTADDEILTSENSETFSSSLNDNSWVVAGEQIVIKTEMSEEDTSPKNEETFMIVINDSNIHDITGDIIEAIE